MHWPNGLKPQRHGGLMELVDVMPTILGLAQTSIPTALSGDDWSPYLLEQVDETHSRSDVFAQHDGNNFMLRSQDWKYLCFNANDPSAGEVLYDLQRDPHEFHNVSTDPAYQSLLTQCRDRLFKRVVEATRPLTPKHHRF